jgi:hypothetical protein
MLCSSWLGCGGLVEDTDPYFAGVVLLLHFDGTAGSTDFLDSTGRHAISSHGSAS